MSNPQNILAKYRTYAYHHILVACDNEASARYIRESNRESIFRDLSIARPVFITEEDKVVGVDVVDESTGKKEHLQVGNYVVILNGLIDTAFVIRDVDWFTATAASTDRHDKFTSIAVEGKMTIEEPRGVRFMNALNGACDLLQTDSTGVIWLLKTIFVGHGIDENRIEFSDYITDLRPLEFMIYDVTGTFSVTGGVYEISFAGANNGAARFPQFSRVAQNISFTPGDAKLSTSITELTRQMNVQSSDNRDCVIKALQDAYSDLDAASLNEFRLVEYAIVLEDPFEEEHYVIDGWTDLEKDSANGQGAFKFGINSTVEQAIRHIMDRCSRVLKDRTEGDGDITYIWKIHSEITMVGKHTRNPLDNSVSENDIVLVVYRIRRQAEVSNKTVETVLNSKDDSTGEVTAQAVKDNLITFDYFFTGKNTDIIDFDLKMEMGLAFLQTVGSTNNIGTGTSQIAGTRVENARVIPTTENDKQNPQIKGPDDPNANEEDPKPKVLIRAKTPIFPATNENNVRTKNVRGAHDSTLFQAMLTKHAALESVEALITIHGNPYLMSQTNKRGSDRDRRAPVDENDPTKQATLMQNWDFIPGLVKVNIFMPALNDTPSSEATFVREKFWYDGYYYLYGIDHKFDDGQFRQDLHLLSLPNQSFLEKAQAADITECGVTEESGGQAGSEPSADDEQVRTGTVLAGAGATNPNKEETD